MAFLSSNTVRHLILNEDLIMPRPDKTRLDHIEGAKYDLSVARVFRQLMFGKVPIIGASMRNIPGAMEIEPHYPTRSSLGWFRLWPWFPYLIQSQEIVTMPNDYLGIVFPRTSIFRGSGRVYGTVIDPGYSGVITVGFDTRHWRGLWLEEDARFASILFATFDEGSVDYYTGVWGYDRLTTNGENERGF